jgi:transglutaminase-like putative cysteine protease
MPRETIEAGVGDCEDSALLLASMIFSYTNERYKIWLIGIMSEDGGHMAVAIPIVGDQLVILDPTGYYHTNSPGYITSKSISVTINEWLQHWSYQMPNAYVDFVFSVNFYEYFDSTSEFIAWAINDIS